MEDVLVCLIFLVLLVVAGVGSRLMAAFPLPLIQIALGSLVGFLFPHFHAGFNPELFMLLFIPPLLFIDSWHFPQREFLHNKRPIIMLSLGLVFFTVAGIGYLLHWLLPNIPLAACFALAAALSPTDAVSLRSLSETHFNGRLRHILQGEALLNDASGLVSFKVAVAAMLTGVFSVGAAAFSLILIGIGGILVGIALTYLFMLLLGHLASKNKYETTTENLLLLLLPFTVYLVAEKLRVSGILAVVAVGFTIDKAGFLDRTMATMRIEGHFIWGLLEITLNGIIFILLGLYIPKCVGLLDEAGVDFFSSLKIIGLITAALILLRAIWIYLTLPLEALIARHRHKPWSWPNLKILMVISFGGVRGAIALAAILSLPTVLPSGIPFPARDLLIIIVMGVVFSSLVISICILPLILPSIKKALPDLCQNEENEAIAAAAFAGRRAIEKKLKSLNLNKTEQEAAICRQVAEPLIANLNQLINSNVGNESEKNGSILALSVEQELRLVALEAARQELRLLRKKGKINNATMMAIIGRLDLRQFSLMSDRKNFNFKQI